MPPNWTKICTQAPIKHDTISAGCRYCPHCAAENPAYQVDHKEAAAVPTDVLSNVHDLTSSPVQNADVALSAPSMHSMVAAGTSNQQRQLTFKRHVRPIPNAGVRAVSRAPAVSGDHSMTKVTAARKAAGPPPRGINIKVTLEAYEVTIKKKVWEYGEPEIIHEWDYFSLEEDINSKIPVVRAERLDWLLFELLSACEDESVRDPASKARYLDHYVRSRISKETGHPVRAPKTAMEADDIGTMLLPFVRKSGHQQSINCDITIASMFAKNKGSYQEHLDYQNELDHFNKTSSRQGSRPPNSSVTDYRGSSKTSYEDSSTALTSVTTGTATGVGKGAKRPASQELTNRSRSQSAPRRFDMPPPTPSIERPHSPTVKPERLPLPKIKTEKPCPPVIKTERPGPSRTDARTSTTQPTGRLKSRTAAVKLHSHESQELPSRAVKDWVNSIYISDSDTNKDDEAVEEISPPITCREARTTQWSLLIPNSEDGERPEDEQQPTGHLQGIGLNSFPKGKRKAIQQADLIPATEAQAASSDESPPVYSSDGVNLTGLARSKHKHKAAQRTQSVAVAETEAASASETHDAASVNLTRASKGKQKQKKAEAVEWTMKTRSQMRHN